MKNIRREKIFSYIYNEYLLFSIIVLIAICIMASGFCCYSYHVYGKKKKNILLQLSKDLSFDLFNVFNENENILKFFGSKISNHISPNNLNDIFNLLISNVDLNIPSMTKSCLSWVNADGKVTVCGKHGIFPKCGNSRISKKYPDIRDKDYFVDAKHSPWTLQFSQPCCSFSGNSYILPTAMGIHNKHRKFIGYLILGLRIDHINHYIEKIINQKKASYILLDKNFKSIASSDEQIQSIEDLIDDKQMLHFISNNNTVLPVSFQHNNIKYNYLSKIPEYPFFILLGYDINIYKHDFLNRISPILIEFLVMGILYLILLYFFRKKIISPINDLSKLASSISTGNLQVKIPKQHSTELFSLAKNLALVIKHIKKTELQVQKLKFANQISKDSEQARAEFTKSMHYEFENYFKEIFIYFNFIYKYLKNHVVPLDHKVIQCSNKIQELITMVNSKTSNILNLSYFHISYILEYAIKVNLKIAFSKDIFINTDFQQDMPKIYADELRIKQVFISLIRQSIENSPSNSKIFITINSYIENNFTWFEVNIKDQSFGLDEYTLEDIESKFNKHNDITIFEFIKMKIESIEKIILMHKGSLKIVNKLSDGRELQVLLPLLDQEDYLQKCDITHLVHHKFSNV